ncbi:hypothetical protein Q9R19_01295 [Microbacterium sp. ARD32]|uniref:hypothetical protein n=1 Tax=Microbacterium sp. ARD32 TaxID=2962577 RepID=UPI002881161B|nr:hypothetical protein [Microbacterium sp. ARD32]MDT0156251.1 hypothetical protein [Microbacterium sp. ARD32]
MSLVVAPEQWEAPQWFQGKALGVPVLGSAFSAGASLGSGDWAGALGSGAGLVGDVVGMATDPLGTLASSLAGFLLDRMSWFQEALNVLVGNPAVVTAVGLTWSNVGGVLAAQSERLIAIRDRTAEYWHGQAADAFRERLTQMAERAQIESAMCQGLNSGFAIGSAIVRIVRDIVSAICAELVGKLIVWVGEALATAGFGLPAIVAQATSAIARWVSKASKWCDELLDSAGRFGELVNKLYKAFDEVKIINTTIGPGSVLGLRLPAKPLQISITPDVIVGAGANGVDQEVKTLG